MIDCSNFGKFENDKCECPVGFGGQDCSDPLCGSLAQAHRPARTGPSCHCVDGYTGINCNLCQNENSCSDFGFIDPVCYKGNQVIDNSFKQCTVTNPAIRTLLKEKMPQVTIGCNRQSEQCDFQFWVAEIESFFCKLTDCDFNYSITNSTIAYKCQRIRCKCIPGKLLCGENGSLDLTEWLESPEEGPVGPAIIKCTNSLNASHPTICSFEEDNMNTLISQLLGDSYISLSCDTAACLDRASLPDAKYPAESYGMVLSGIFIMVSTLFIAWVLFILKNRSSSRTRVAEQSFDQQHSSPACDFYFSNIGVDALKSGISTTLLHSIKGVAKTGQLMALMGPSGSGKSTLLNVLGSRSDHEYRGEIMINGHTVIDKAYAGLIGYVDQSDALLGSLTVFETILFAAMVQLPVNMSHIDKYNRVYEILLELDILHIAHHLIGIEGISGNQISGGERRRVSIGCELIRNPSILLLDEPTSGLDAYNAYNVVECLKILAEKQKKTIIISIHQPRSNIFALFDQIVLLAQGRLLYSGYADNCLAHFESIGFKCPEGYNTADFLVDLAMNSSGIPSSSTKETNHEFLIQKRLVRKNLSINHATLSLLNPLVSIATTVLEENTRHNVHLLKLENEYFKSQVSRLIDDEIRGSTGNNLSSSILDLVSSATVGKPGFSLQLKYLLRRAFKNVYRNPYLLLNHLMISFVIALCCGTLFWQMTVDLGGFQNRLGLFFFLCTVFAFSCLSSIQAFVEERLVFQRERANGYYLTSAYYISKILLDLIPLRIIPPIILACIIYPMTGLQSSAIHFFKFLFALVMFNMTGASLCLMISTFFKDAAQSTLVSTMIILVQMLFGGLLLNSKSLPVQLAFLNQFSIFNCALEAMAVSEVNGLILSDHKFGLQIDVPGAVVLQTFGFDVNAFSADMIKLLVLMCLFLLFGFIGLQRKKGSL